MTTETTIRARYTGDKKVTYRWVAEIGSGKLVPAQVHPAAVVTADTWSDQVDGRSVHKTSVRLPVGLLVVDSERGYTDHPIGDITYTAAILGDGKLDYAAARHVRFAREEILPDAEDAPMVPGTKRAKVAVHYVEVGGVVGRYVCEGAS